MIQSSQTIPHESMLNRDDTLDLLESRQDISRADRQVQTRYQSVSGKGIRFEIMVKGMGDMNHLISEEQDGYQR